MKKTLLFCLSLLAFSLHSFAEKGYVYERINTLDELVTGKYVIALEGSTALKECYAITDKGAGANVGLTDLADEHLVSSFLVNVPSTVIADVTLKSNNQHTILYDTKSMTSSSPVTLSSGTGYDITITQLRTSHFDIKYNSNYLCAKTKDDLSAKESKTSTTVRWKDQHSQTSKTIAEASYANKFMPGAFSFFIQREAQTIILDNAGVKTEHIGVTSLPTTSRTVDGHTERIYRWRDSEGNLFVPGTIYPTEGYYNGDAPITLTAIYREFEEYWLPISNHVDIDNGDTIVLAVEDGGNGGKCYALTKPAGQSNCTMTAKNQPFDATCKFLVFDSDPTNDNASFKLDALNGYYLFISGNVQLHTNISLVTLIPFGDGHYKIRLSTTYCGVQQKLTFATSTSNPLPTSYINQHETGTNITSLQTSPARYAAAWTIYRKVMCYYGTATFNVRDDQGLPVAALSGKTITFPSASAKFGWNFVGWSKKPEGPIYRKAGETAYLSGDQTFYAVYEPTVFLTLNLNNHGHWETEDQQNDSIMGGPSHVLPEPTGNFSYGFMGWAKTPTATTPQYLAGETYAITEDETLYAVYKDTHIFRPIHSLDDMQDGDRVVIAFESGANDNAYIALKHSQLTTGSSMTVDTMSLTPYLIDKEALLHPDENVVFDFYKEDDKWLFGVDRLTQTSKFFVRYSDPSSTTAAKKISLINANSGELTSQWTPIWRETSHRIYLKNGNAYYMTWTVATPSYFSGTKSSVIDDPSNSNQKICDQIAWWKNLSAKARVGSYDRLQAAITLYKAVPNDTLFYDANGGTIEGNITQSIGGTLFLPVASKKGFVFKGWSDGEHLYKAGTCYPASGNMNGSTTLTAEFVVTRNSFERLSSLTQLQDGDTIIMTFEDGVGRGTDAFKEYGIVMENCTTKVNETNIANTDKINLDSTYKWVITKAYNGTYRLYNAASKAFLSIGTSTKVTFEKACIYYMLDKYTPGAYLDEQIDSVQINLTHWANNSMPAQLTNRANTQFFVYCPKVTTASLKCGLTTSYYAKNQWTEGGGKTLVDMDGGNSIQYPKPAAITIYRMKQAPICHYVFDAGEHGTCSTTSLNDVSIVLPNVTPDTDYDFLGWWDGSQLLAAGTVYSCDRATITLIAQYETTHIVYDLRGHGQWEDGSTGNRSIDGKIQTLPQIEGLSGYYFMGWSESETGNPFTAYKAGSTWPLTGELTESVTLYAIYIPINIFRPVTGLEQLVDGEEYIVGLKSGNRVREYRAINISDTHTFSPIDLTSYWQGDAMRNVPSSAILTASRDGQSWTFYHAEQDNDYYLKAGTSFTTAAQEVAKGGTYTGNRYTLPFDETDQSFYLVFRSSSDDYFVRYCKTSNNSTPSFAADKTNVLDQLKAGRPLYLSTSSGPMPRQFTLFRHYPNAAIIRFDAQGGQCDIDYELAYCAHVPNITKGDSVLYYWTDGSAHQYRAGDRYPTVGEAQENVTLRAVYRKKQVVYTPIQNFNEIADGDSVMIVIEDGGTGKRRFALQMVNAEVHATELPNMPTPIIDPSSKYAFAAYNKTTASKKTMGFSHSSGRKLFSSGSNLTGVFAPDSMLWWNITSTSVLSRKNNTFFMNATKLDNYSTSTFVMEQDASDFTATGSYTYQRDQYAKKLNITEFTGSEYAGAWTLYIQHLQFESTITLDLKGLGTLPTDTVIKAYNYTLPKVTPKPYYTFLGWTNNTSDDAFFPVGTVVYMDCDTVWEAIYERTHITFDMLGKATTLGGNTSDSVVVDMDVTLPDLRTDYGLRLIGWATTLAKAEAGTADAGAVGAAFHSDTTMSVYAVYSNVTEDPIYQQITATSAIQKGDTLAIVMEDGNGGENRYALEIRNGTLSASNFDSLHVSLAQRIVVTNKDKTYRYGVNGDFPSNEVAVQLQSAKYPTYNLRVVENYKTGNYQSSTSSGTNIGLYPTPDGIGSHVQLIDYFSYNSSVYGHYLRVQQQTSSVEVNTYIKSPREHTLYYDQHASDNKKNISDMASGACTWTIYTRVTKYAYTVSYDANGGTGAPAPSSGWRVTLGAATTRDGYEFIGWATSKAKADAQIADAGQPGGIFCTEQTHDITLYAAYEPVAISLSESANNATTLEASHGKSSAISLQRILSTASLNTFAVPFDMNATEIETTFGEGTELYAMSTVQVENGILTIFFEDASSIEAGTPYLMRPTKNDMPAVIEISSRTIDNTLRPVSNNGITFHPVFSPTTLNADGKTLFLSTGDLLYRPITTGSMKGLRAYFTQDEVTSAPIRYMIGRPHGIITDWNEINGEDQLTKFIHNGQLLIRKNGKLYNALGAEIKK